MVQWLIWHTSEVTERLAGLVSRWWSQYLTSQFNMAIPSWVDATIGLKCAALCDTRGH